MKKQLIIVSLFMSVTSVILAQETLSDKVKQAFSLVGHWEIIKMRVLRASSLSNPNTIPAAAIGKVSITVASELGSYGSFDVSPQGNITGSGEAQYTYQVSAGSTAFSFGNITFPVGAVAMMDNDDGVRDFTLTGSADLVKRTIQLNAFKSNGNALKMIMRPGNSTFSASLWPPMTNISSTKVIVNGSSLLLRASGVLSGIKVSFEAVKYVDLESLFTTLDDFLKKR